MKEKYDVGLFFYVNGRFLVHGCSLDEAEKYGDFLIYPESHYNLWDRYYIDKHDVDFDYYPRGRIAYRRADNAYLVLYDRCIGKDINHLVERYSDRKVVTGYDEHYQCHSCNEDYVL